MRTNNLPTSNRAWGAALIAVGTPIAAILVWRNRAKLLPKPTPEEARAEAALTSVGKRRYTR